MKKVLIILTIFALGLYSIFANNSYNYPNILIKGHLGEDVAPSIILSVNSTVIEENGVTVALDGNFNFSTNTSSLSVPVYAYISYPSYSHTGNIIFNLEISTNGFHEKSSTGALIGSPLDVDIVMNTSSLNTSSLIIANSISSSRYSKYIFVDSVSTPASFIYTVAPGTSIEDPNFQIWFTWEDDETIPAGQYGSLISFAITAI